MKTKVERIKDALETAIESPSLRQMAMQLAIAICDEPEPPAQRSARDVAIETAANNMLSTWFEQPEWAKFPHELSDALAMPAGRT